VTDRLALARPTHATVKAARRLRRRRERTASARLLVEGPHALAEAIDHTEQVFLADPASEQARRVARVCEAAGIPLLMVTPGALAALADSETPQGVIGVARRPETDLAALLDSATLLVVLDGVADPGNAGTIIRTADAAGADGVVLTAGSVDPTNAKAVRASAGSLFHLPVIDGVEVEHLVAGCRAAGLRLVAAVAGAPTPYHDLCLTAPAAIVFGNEAHGLSGDFARLADVAVSVPMKRPVRRGYRGHAESLNLATTTAVVLFEVVRQRDPA
jgi:TrmH family RNA methyltransferase